MGKRITEVFLAITLLVSAATGLAQDNGRHVIVGVLSPDLGSLLSMGHARRHWIEAALKSNQTVLAENPIQIELLYRDTRSQEDNEFCADQARELMEAGAALIFGPVRSGCVASVLAAGLPIPVIATLASATSLTENRSEWFFRANINDAERLRTLWIEVLERRARTAARSGRGLFRSVALSERSKYGDGLARDLIEVARPEAVALQALPATLSLSEATELLDNALGDGGDAQQDLFLLGTATEPAITAILQALSRAAREGGPVHAIYTVGSSSELLHLSPQGTVAVGEPALGDVPRDDLAAEIAQRLQQAPEDLDFYPTTYQAARFIIPEAITRAAATLTSLDDLGALRNAIREELETGRFHSLKSPASVQFTNGEMNTIFEVPVYEIAPEYRRVDRASAAPGWLEFPDERLDINFLEAPLKVRVTGHQTEASAVQLSLYRETASGSAEAWEQLGQPLSLDLKDGDSELVTFHVRQPGHYELRSNVQSYPLALPVRVALSPFYMICALAAVLAVILKHKFASISWSMRAELLLEGTLAALAVAFSATYIQYSLIPVSPLDWNLINAVIYGFLGGWFGPALITQLSNRAVPAREAGG